MSGESKSTLAQIRDQRIEKANKLREMGIDPYPSKSFRNEEITKIVSDYDSFDGKSVILAGRLMSWREHGQLVFGHIQDPSGKIQVYIKQETLELTNVENQTLGWDDLKYFDIGDIIEVEGTVTKTQRGEISIEAKTTRMLTKAIRPLPEKWKGLKDKEMLFRQRYLDTIMNPDKKWRFEKSAKILYAIREYLDKKGFLEIKTPIIQPIYGGTSAKPFKTHVNALNTEYYLSVSHELYLKRLITGGFENVVNIVGYFRNEGIDRTHNPEFSMLETMTAYQNYEYNMDLVEDLYLHIANTVFERTKFMVGEKEIDFAKKWRRVMMIDAVKEFAGIDFEKIETLGKAHKILTDIGFKDKFPETIGECMVVVFEEKVEEQLIEPIFITGHPVEISPLAKQMADQPKYSERFEMFIGGFEAGDNWTELNDPVLLYNRFKDQVMRGRGGDDEAHPMDIAFIEMMEYGMPPTTGLGPGIERMVMMFTETSYIDDVMYFPMQKPAPITSLQKEIYDEEYITVGLGGSQKETKSNVNGQMSDVKQQDKSKKMVLVLQKGLEGWQLTNTIGHLSAYLGNKIKSFQPIDEFKTSEGEGIKANSQYPVVTLGAKPGQMFNLLKKVEESELVHLAYIEEMIEFGDDEMLIKEIGKKQKNELNYLGIGIFGDNNTIDALTKKFSLFK